MKGLVLAAASAAIVLVAWSCGSATCVYGQQIGCACTNGKMGAQTCAANGRYNACECTDGTTDGGTNECNASSCAGCCDSTKTCWPGDTTATCGVGGQACAICTTSQVCSSGACSTTVTKRVFVSASSYTGNLGGLAGADLKCNQAAQGATLGGTWKAWMSDGTTNAIDRISDVGPWKLVGTNNRVFNNKVNLTTVPLTAINRNEQGVIINTVGFVEVWTGTVSSGVKAANHCASWTSNDMGGTLVAGSTGALQSTTSQWTEYSQTSCAQSHRIYCIEQ